MLRLLYNWYTKPNKISLAVFAGFWLVTAVALFMAMYQTKQNIIGYICIYSACRQVVQLFTNYYKHKPGI